MKKILISRKQMIQRAQKLFDMPSFVVKLLNIEDHSSDFDRKMIKELQWLVDKWLDSGRPEGSGPNVVQMFKTLDPKDVYRFPVQGTCNFEPTESANMLTIPFPAADMSTSPSPENHARGFFTQLVTSPECERVAGPCKQCGKYFVKKTRHRTVYCSRTCGSYTTAVKANNLRYAAAKQRKLAVAKRAIADFDPLNDRVSWEDFAVSRMAREGLVIQAKSLHRWVNDEERIPGSGLQLPPSLRLQRGHRNAKG